MLDPSLRWDDSTEIQKRAYGALLYFLCCKKVERTGQPSFASLMLPVARAYYKRENKMPTISSRHFVFRSFAVRGDTSAKVAIK